MFSSGSEAADHADVLHAYGIACKVCVAGTVGGAHIPADKLYHVVEAAGVQELAAVPSNALKTFHEWDWGRRSAAFT